MLLGINIDHVATLRQARYQGMLDAPHAEPSVLEAARAAQAGGADSITIHVREDRRHMQDADAYHIREHISLPLNLEMAATPEMLAFALDLKPDYVCLVPEKREEVTTEGGLNVAGQLELLAPIVSALSESGIKVSLFIDPDIEQIRASAQLGAPMIELHTGCFANTQGAARKKELARLVAAADVAHQLGLRVHAGHGIQLSNLADLAEVPHLQELNIGHTIVSRALIIGFQSSVLEMRDAIAAQSWTN